MIELLALVPTESSRFWPVAAWRTSICSHGTSNSSAAIWASAVWMPCPISTLGMKTRTRLAGLISNQAIGGALKPPGGPPEFSMN